MSMAIDKAKLAEHVKQERQKAKNTKVPTHLWSFFFRMSFLRYFGSVSGASVKWKKGHQNVYR